MGQQVRDQSGQLSGFVLDSLRGLSETLQYGQGKNRRQELERQGGAIVSTGGNGQAHLWPQQCNHQHGNSAV